MRNRSRSHLLALALLTAGCMPQLQLPMSGAELTAYPPRLAGPALVAYLGQQDASPAVCDLHADGPHVEALDKGGRSALTHALTQGQVPSELWRSCVSAMLRSASAPDSAALLDTIGRDYQALLVSADLDKSPAKQERLAAMQQLYSERKNGIDGTARAQGALFAELRRALARRRLGPVATRFGQELIEVFDLEHGLWTGRPVDVAMLDSLVSARDEKTLRLFVDRLPAPALRDAALRRIIRLRIATSRYPEVREHARQVEESLLKQGTYPLALAEHPPMRGFIDAARMPVRGVLVRQDSLHQTARLLAYSGEDPSLSILPDLSLRGVLMIEVAGISRPVTLCGPAESLDPTPCVAAGDVQIENPTAYLDRGGSFRFVDHIRMQEAVGLAQLSGPFSLPVSAGGKRLLSLDWPLYFGQPEDLVFTSSTPGADGPALRVRVDPLNPQSRLIFTVTGVGTYFAVVEDRDAASFSVASRGAQGEGGAAGSSGSDGVSGGQCSDGTNGSDGSSGGPGGPGGSGGSVKVQASCGGLACDRLIARLRTTIRSQGGAGGSGGPGGRGGSGGWGGSARSATTHTDENGNTVTDDPGCSAGSNGSSGSDGPSGSDGDPGRDGYVSFAAASEDSLTLAPLPGVPTELPGAESASSAAPDAGSVESRQPRSLSPLLSYRIRPEVRPEVKIEHPGLHSAGVALTILGVAAAVTGGVLVGVGAYERANPLPPISSDPAPGQPLLRGGGALLGAGAAMAITGIILLAESHTQVFRSGQLLALRLPGTRLALSPMGLHF